VGRWGGGGHWLGGSGGVSLVGPGGVTIYVAVFRGQGIMSPLEVGAFYFLVLDDLALAC
jgi:hypothetical protein